MAGQLMNNKLGNVWKKVAVALKYYLVIRLQGRRKTMKKVNIYDGPKLTCVDGVNFKVEDTRHFNKEEIVRKFNKHPAMPSIEKVTE
jgi:hypothetical protein